MTKRWIVQGLIGKDKKKDDDWSIIPATQPDGVPMKEWASHLLSGLQITFPHRIFRMRTI